MLPAPPRPEENAAEEDLWEVEDECECDCDDVDLEEEWMDDEGAVLVVKWVSGEASITGGTGCVRLPAPPRPKVIFDVLCDGVGS